MYGEINNIIIITKCPKGVNTIMGPVYAPSPQTVFLNSGGFRIGEVLHGKIFVSVLVKNQCDKNIKIRNIIIVHFVGLKNLFQFIYYLYANPYINSY